MSAALQLTPRELAAVEFILKFALEDEEDSKMRAAIQQVLKKVRAAQ